MTEKKGKADVIDAKAVLAGTKRSFARWFARLQEVLEAEMTEAVGAG